MTLFYSAFVLSKHLNESFYLHSNTEEKPPGHLLPLFRKYFISSRKIFSNEDESIFPHIFFAGTAAASGHLL